MISVPQPHGPSTPPPAPERGDIPPAVPPSVPPARRARRGLVIGGIVAAVMILVVAAGVLALVLGLGIDLAFVGLVFGFLFFGLIGFVLRFFPESLPVVPSVRRIVNFLALAALAGLIYLYAYPVTKHAMPGGVAPSLGNPHPRYSQQPLNHEVDVVYSVSGAGQGSNITMAPAVGGAGSTSAVALPFERQGTASISTKVSTGFILTATVPDDGSGSGDDAVQPTVSCTITVDGVVIAHEEASGANSIAFCRGEVPASSP